MENLKRGTPCFLVNLTERRELCGLVVEVVEGPMPFNDEPGLWYEVSAAWIREQYHGCAITVKRENLKPIIPPEPRTLELSSPLEIFGALQ